MKNKILDEAKKNRIIVTEIRDIEDFDEKSPFGNFTVSIGGSSIFGMSGERIFNKIALTNTGEYWVQVKTIFFVPTRVKWKKKTTGNKKKERKG